MLRQRVITALILAALVLLVIFFLPHVATMAALALLVVAAAWEWSAFPRFTQHSARIFYVAVVAACVAGTWWFGVERDEMTRLIQASLLWWVLALIWVAIAPERVNSTTAAVAGLLVLVPAWLALVRLHGHRPQLLLFLFLLVVAADVGAYFAGRAFGRNKLAPRVSPGKTWEGVMGGFVAAALLAAARRVVVRGGCTALSRLVHDRRRGFDHRRSHREPVQASRRPEGQRHAVAGPRRRAGPRRQRHGRGAGLPRRSRTPGVAAMSAPMRVAVLGSTGSIGVSTLDVLERHRDRYAVFALAARSNVARLREQCLQHRPRFAVVVDNSAAALLATQLRSAGSSTEVLVGEQALSEIAAHAEVDAVMAAIVGAAGLPSSLAAARAGKRILLANKEALVMSGPLFMQAVREGGATLIPVDSEHNAIFQCMGGSRVAGVRRVLLTASGGPFLRTPAADLRNVTPDQACAHPRWVMGRKISVDSATLMNKGLELIEACLLFGLPARQVEVVVHPQSIVHSLVEYFDGSMLAQLGNPDMRTPIAHALGWPERLSSGVESLDILRAARLDFEAPDLERFPAWPWRAAPRRPAVPHRRCSTPRTKSRSTRSSKGAAGFRTSSR